jgi:methoxymalonate biosynthesis acyl carrier protein
MESTIKEKIKVFLSKFIQSDDLQDDQDIFSLGFINSLFAMQLVLFVENEFGIAIENEDLNIDNFKTIISITKLVEQKAVV